MTVSQEKVLLKGRGLPFGIKREQLFISALAVAGMLVSAYLTWVHWNEAPIFCGIGKGCDVVGFSIYSEVLGIPVAFFGFLMYAALLVLSLLERKLKGVVSHLVLLAIFGLSLAGALVSAYLTYIELFVLHTICTWCVASALIITTIFVLSARHLSRLLARKGGK